MNLTIDGRATRTDLVKREFVYLHGLEFLLSDCGELGKWSSRAKTQRFQSLSQKSKSGLQ